MLPFAVAAPVAESEPSVAALRRQQKRRQRLVAQVTGSTCEEFMELVIAVGWITALRVDDGVGNGDGFQLVYERYSPLI